MFDAATTNLPPTLALGIGSRRRSPSWRSRSNLAQPAVTLASPSLKQQCPRTHRRARERPRRQAKVHCQRDRRDLPRVPQNDLPPPRTNQHTTDYLTAGTPRVAAGGALLNDRPTRPTSGPDRISHPTTAGHFLGSKSRASRDLVARLGSEVNPENFCVSLSHRIVDALAVGAGLSRRLTQRAVRRAAEPTTPDRGLSPARRWG